MGRSERLIKPRDSWFSSKCIEVQRRVFMNGGRALKGLGGIPVYQPLSNSEYQVVIARQLDGGGEAPFVKRETAQIAS